MNTPIPTKQQNIRILILAVFQLAIAVAVTFDLLAWWGGNKLWEDAGWLVMIFVCIAAMPVFVMPLIWEGILAKALDRPAQPFQKAAGFFFLTVDVLAALALIAVYTLGLRSLSADGTRLVGYLVPGGHAKAILTVDTSSLENSFHGSLTTSTANQAESKTYMITQGSVIHGRKITQYDPISIRHTISIPEGVEGDLALNWSLVGATKVAESGGGYREFYAASGVANAPVYYNDVETSASGGIIISGDLYPPFLRGLVMFKENNVFLLYAGLFVIWNLSYMFLVRSKSIPTFTAPPEVRAAQARPVPAPATKPDARPQDQRFPPGAKVVDPDHVFGPCHLCGKQVKRDVVVEWGQVVYKMVGSRCKSCGTIFCTGHSKELGSSLLKGYQSNCPKCGNPLNGIVEVLS